MEAITFVELLIYINSSVEEGNFFLSYLNYDISMKFTWNIFWHLQKNQQGSFQNVQNGLSHTVCNPTHVPWLHISKCGVWESGAVAKSEKEKQTFHAWTHPLTDTLIHHTHILSYLFWFTCYRPGRHTGGHSFPVTGILELCTKWWIGRWLTVHVHVYTCSVCLGP